MQLLAMGILMRQQWRWPKGHHFDLLKGETPEEIGVL